MKRKDKKKIVEEEVLREEVEQQMEDDTQPIEDEKQATEENWKAKFNEMNDKYLRLYSEFDNYRKRTIKEKMDLQLNASADVITDLLSVIDDFERAMQHNVDVEDANSLKEGFDLIYIKILNILKGKGLKPMESLGEVFDYNHHEAITNIPAQNNEDKGKVMDVIQKGYYLNDKVLRYAKVVVGQ